MSTECNATSPVQVSSIPDCVKSVLLVINTAVLVRLAVLSQRHQPDLALKQRWTFFSTVMNIFYLEISWIIV